MVLSLRQAWNDCLSGHGKRWKQIPYAGYQLPAHSVSKAFPERLALRPVFQKGWGCAKAVGKRMRRNNRTFEIFPFDCRLGAF